MPRIHTSEPSRFYWCEPTGGGRNSFCIFERTFQLDRVPEFAEVSIFADSLYRLIVNRRIMGYGPARFHPAHPEFDVHDLRRALFAGDNQVRIEVNSRGTSCYQAMPGPGGLALTGRVDGMTLDLPEGWQVRLSSAWDAGSELFSFAQGPVEICDTRVLDGGEDALCPLVAVEKQNHWGNLTPRTIATPSQVLKTPARISKCATLKTGTFRVGFRCPLEDGGRQPFFTSIFSPGEQEVVAGTCWGPIALHGVWLKPAPGSTTHGLKETILLPLKAGWNFLFGMPEILSPGWVWQMELPGGLGLKISGRAESAEPSTFFTGPVTADNNIPKNPPHCKEELVGFPDQWTAVGPNHRPPSPARELAWDVTSTDLLPPGSPWEAGIVLTGTDDKTLVLDMGDEYLGHAFVEIEASAGTTLDIGYDERLKANGTPDYFRCNPLVNSADRFVLRGGRQRIETFHERGGRYLQLTFRDAAGPIKVLDAGIRSACGDYPQIGNFHCGDEDLDWAWQAGDRTLRTSMADGWIDPWRERGLYIGDALVQGHATRKITSDWRLDPWCLRLWARSQFPDGQLPDVVPSTPHRPLCDYTLIWILSLRNYWAASGDLDLVRELWPTIPRIFSSPVWKPAESGLWEVTPEMKIFIDWGVVPEERMGTNAVLNAFRFEALRCAGEMAAALGNVGAANKYHDESKMVREAFQSVFWSSEAGRYIACLIDGKPFLGPSMHANALALAFEMTDDAQTELVADFLTSGLCLSEGFPEGRCEIYFLYYALDGLYRAGRADAAENAMREYYGIMRRAGAWTLWETLMRGAKGLDSMCHGWSSGAIPFLAERVLGVRPLMPGDPSRILVAPESETLDHAEGTIAHPFGPISVRWTIQNHCLAISVKKPQSVEIEIRPQGRLGRLELVLENWVEDAQA